eukprot:711961-Prorocentrum_minimum.AAC.1
MGPVADMGRTDRLLDNGSVSVELHGKMDSPLPPPPPHFPGCRYGTGRRYGTGHKYRYGTGRRYIRDRSQK